MNQNTAKMPCLALASMLPERFIYFIRFYAFSTFDPLVFSPLFRLTSLLRYSVKQHPPGFLKFVVCNAF